MPRASFERLFRILDSYGLRRREQKRVVPFFVGLLLQGLVEYRYRKKSTYFKLTVRLASHHSLCFSVSNRHGHIQG